MSWILRFEEIYYNDLDYTRDEHRVRLIVYHLIWTPKRRKAVLVGEVAKDCRALIVAKLCAERLDNF